MTKLNNKYVEHLPVPKSNPAINHPNLVTKLAKFNNIRNILKQLHSFCLSACNYATTQSPKL